VPARGEEGVEKFRKGRTNSLKLPKGRGEDQRGDADGRQVIKRRRYEKAMTLGEDGAHLLEEGVRGHSRENVGGVRVQKESEISWVGKEMIASRKDWHSGTQIT